ncbi:4861_t:CDS:2, partial [Funneliformis caledonium]
MCPLNGHTWLWNGLDICTTFRDYKNAKSPLNIGVANFHSNLCIGPLPSSLITHIQEQMENDDFNTISFDDGKNFRMNKFLIDIDEEIMKFLNAFRDVVVFGIVTDAENFYFMECSLDNQDRPSFKLSEPVVVVCNDEDMENM